MKLHPRKVIIFIFIIFLVIITGKGSKGTDFKLHIYSEKSIIYLSCSLITWKVLEPSAGSTVKTNYTQKESLYLFVFVYISQYDVTRMTVHSCKQQNSKFFRIQNRIDLNTVRWNEAHTEIKSYKSYKSKTLRVIKIAESVEMTYRKRRLRYFREEGNYMQVRASHIQ